MPGHRVVLRGFLPGGLQGGSACIQGTEGAHLDRGSALLPTAVDAAAAVAAAAAA
eukprot:CAMPEP_0115264458 /NCGR_PEP_ID=MMETSP0270-20121206/50440_1 /TAXON_ID=71861 /ORGANISM="Scrippsiella trochoidea, Strain CCMP3099" /LENGTH=54 /DNA_ID=CAMNT_0002680479 /DNA_START=114 /DNA_END=274 /DNA_ORIENTATION=-